MLTTMPVGYDLCGQVSQFYACLHLFIILSLNCESKEKVLIGALSGTVKLREGLLTALAGEPQPRLEAVAAAR